MFLAKKFPFCKVCSGSHKHHNEQGMTQCYQAFLVFPLKLPENCLILKKSWGPGLRPPLDPLLRGIVWLFLDVQLYLLVGFPFAAVAQSEADARAGVAWDLGLIHTGRAHANSNANPLMLLVCSVNTPIHTHRFRLVWRTPCKCIPPPQKLRDFVYLTRSLVRFLGEWRGERLTQQSYILSSADQVCRNHRNFVGSINGQKRKQAPPA